MTRRGDIFEWAARARIEGGEVLVPPPEPADDRCPHEQWGKNRPDDEAEILYRCTMEAGHSGGCFMWPVEPRVERKEADA